MSRTHFDGVRASPDDYRTRRCRAVRFRRSCLDSAGSTHRPRHKWKLCKTSSRIRRVPSGCSRCQPWWVEPILGRGDGAVVLERGPATTRGERRHLVRTCPATRLQRGGRIGPDGRVQNVEPLAVSCRNGESIGRRQAVFASRGAVWPVCPTPATRTPARFSQRARRTGGGWMEA